MISRGHREADLLNSSIKKIQFYYRLAREEQHREESAGELATMKAVYRAAAAIYNADNFDSYKEAEDCLKGIINGSEIETPNSPAPGLALIHRSLAAAGAVVSQQPLS